METKKVKIRREEKVAYLVFSESPEKLEINLSEDNPNKVKIVFNALLKDLKKGQFRFELEDTVEDLYFHICLEYIKQLNVELGTVFNELKDYKLLESSS